MNAVYAPINVNLRGGRGGAKAGDLNLKHLFGQMPYPRDIIFDYNTPPTKTRGQIRFTESRNIVIKMLLVL